MDEQIRDVTRHAPHATRVMGHTNGRRVVLEKRKGSGRALILIDIMAEPLTVIYIYTNTPNARDDNTFLFAPSLNTIDKTATLAK